MPSKKIDKVRSEIDLEEDFNIALSEFHEPSYIATEKTHSDKIQPKETHVPIFDQQPPQITGS